MARQVEVESELIIYIGMRKIVLLEGLFQDHEVRVNRYLKVFNPAGFKNGFVTNLGEAAQTIQSAVDQLVPATGKHKGGVTAWVIVGNAKLGRYTFESSMYFKGDSRPISSFEVRSIIHQTKTVATLPLTEMILQVNPESYLVDDVSGVQNPIGLEARRLGVQLKIYTMNHQEYKNLQRCFESTDVDVQGFVPKTLTVSEAVLNADEKQQGVAVLDFSCENTQLAYWKDHVMVGVRDIPIGTHQLVEKLSKYFSIEMHDAEKLVEQYGVFQKSSNHADELIPLVERQGITSRQIHLQEFQEVFIKFAAEWVQGIISASQEFLGQHRASCPNFVLSGGGALLDGFIEHLMKEYSIVARIGLTKRLEAPHELLVDPSMTPALGGLRWVAAHQRELQKQAMPEDFIRRNLSSFRDWFFKYF